MADRPDETLEWATSGANVIAPSSGKKTTGWLPGEQPPAAWWNWYKNLGGRWVQYLDEQRAAIVLALANVARIDVSNIFGLTQRINVGDPMSPLLTTDKTAFDKADGTTSTNGWKLVTRFPTDGSGRNVSLYVGANDSSGMLALVVNAFWQIGGTYHDKWTREAGGKDSFAIVQIGTQFRFSRVLESEPSHWSEWPTDGDVSLAVAGTATAAHVTATTDVSAPTIKADLFQYRSVGIRKTYIPLAEVHGASFMDFDSATHTHVRGVLFAASATSDEKAQGLRWTVRPLIGGVLGKIVVRVNIVNGTDTFRIVKRSNSFPLVGDGWASAVVATRTSDGTGLQTVEIPTTSIDDNDESEYEIVWTLGLPTDDPALTGNTVIAIRREWFNIGPWSSGQ